MRKFIIALIFFAAFSGTGYAGNPWKLGNAQDWYNSISNPQNSTHSYAKMYSMSLLNTLGALGMLEREKGEGLTYDTYDTIVINFIGDNPSILSYPDAHELPPTASVYITILKLKGLLRSNEQIYKYLKVILDEE